MISYDEMPEDNSELSKIKVEFPVVPIEDIPKPQEFENDLLEYLEAEDYQPDDKMEFLRTAKVENTIYWIWKFKSLGDEVYATVAMDKNGITIGCEENHYNLTPEQYILGGYHNCF